MPGGYNGKILRVDLSRCALSVETPPDNFYRTYLGGRNFVAYYLLKGLKGGEDALGPENKLIFAAGVLTGLPTSGTGRNSVGAKSPLTGVYGDAEVGGYWGAELKHAGFDAIIIEGQASSPVYLWIQDGQAEIRDARHLWGLTTGECERRIKEELGDRAVRVAQIGIAGENQVRFACVINDLSHAAGRTGMGAVMGSKNLKAIAVRGHQNVALAKPDAVTAFIKWSREDLKINRAAAWLRDSGTAGVLTGLNAAGGLPTRNFREGVFEGAQKISFNAMKANIMVGRRGCYACILRCKPEVASAKAFKVDPLYGGPEYEALASLGSNCGIDNLEAIAKGNELCNAYGLDTISTGATIAFAMECFEQGIISEKETGGLNLRFGQAEAMVQMVELIARKQGIGQVLAEGTARAAATFGRGAAEFAMQIKGQEVPMHEPRFKQGMGLGYAISPTGADHCHNIHDSVYVRSIPAALKTLGIYDPLPAQELSPAKVRLVHYGVLWQHVLNCVGFCQFVPLDPGPMTELIANITGWNISLWELMKAGERSVTMPRAFNVREGLGKANDHLPRRFFTAFTSGPLKGVAVNQKELAQATEAYYGMMGWDKEGVPTLAKLQELGIEWVAQTLQPAKGG
jgi:aldehyde:ferredoxin oxidoreductase